MKNLRFIVFTVLTLFIFSSGFAQPYTLDEKIVPIKLELKDDKKHKGAKYAAVNVTIADASQYFYVNGFDMFQFIDVFIFSNFGSPNFKVDLVKNTWDDVEKSGTTGESEKGVINFKLRTLGDFGFKVYPGSAKINYTILVYASAPIEKSLGSAFTKASESDIKAADDTSGNEGSASSNSSGSSNTLLYILLGVALLVIGFLASKVLSKNKTTILLLFAALSINYTGSGQVEDVIVLDDGVEEVDLDDIRTEQYIEWLEEEGPELIEDGFELLDEAAERYEFIEDFLEDDERYNVIRDLYDSYTGLGNCISSVPPPGMPRVPSFCDTDECGTCFVNARETFNQNRYSFERLKTIYNCTKTFTDASIAFGDNVSGVHAVSGLAWQSARKKIVKSVQDLQKAYDEKYVELLDKQRRALMELNNCEAQHGIPDWYDRFGYMYYEFTAMHYKRNN